MVHSETDMALLPGFAVIRRKICEGKSNMALIHPKSCVESTDSDFDGQIKSLPKVVCRD